MGKKQKRMEQDPAAAERGRGKPPKPGVRVNVDGLDLGGWGEAFKLDAEKMEKLRKQAEEEAARVAEQYKVPREGEHPKMTSGLFGNGPKMSGGSGRVFVEGVEEFARKFGGGFDASTIMSQLLRAYEVPSAMIGDEQEPRQQLASMLLAIAARVWEGPLGWQFMVGHNVGQNTFWFTAKFYDDEAETVLVEETLEITQKSIQSRTMDEFELDVERQMSQMQERLQADLAAFEEDGL